MRTMKDWCASHPQWFKLACLWLALLMPPSWAGASAALPVKDATGPAASALPPSDFIVGRAYLEDVGSKLAFEQARQQTFTPYKGVFNRGYTESTHWLRLSLAPSDTPLVLRMTPIWLDEITVFDPSVSSLARTVGDHFPASANDFLGLGFSFELPASAAPRDVWLRLKTTSAHRLDISVMPVHQLPSVNASALLWAALYSAVLVMIFLVLLAVWVSQPDPVLGAFLVRHAAFSYFGMAYLGLPTLLLSDWLSPAFLDLAFSLVVIASVPVGLRFDHLLLSTYNPNRHLLAALRWMVWPCMGLVLLLFAGQQRLALELNANLMALIVFVVFATALSCKPVPSVEQLMPKRLMMVYYTLILGGLLSGLVTVLGWMEPRGWQLHILILHGLASALLMSVMLFVRGQRQLYASQQLSWKLRKAEQEVELEQKRSQEQSQFLHMLMHELKTPLSVVSIALGTRDNKEHNLQLAGRAVQDMKAVIERCVQADRLGLVALQQRLEQVDLGEEIRQLAEGIDGLGPRLVAQLAPGLQVQTDRQLLRTVLCNLLDNAARYGDPVTRVEVQTLAARENARDGMLFRVSNTPGLAGWPDPTQIFSKYYRAAGAHRDSGSGLGLFLAQQLTRTMRGSLRYQPTESLVRFELWIPLTLT